MSFLSLQNNFLTKYSEVYPSSNEWMIIEYKLQLSLGTTTPVVKKIWNVSSPVLTSTFQKKNKGALMLDTFSEASTFDESNRLQKVCQKGFEFSSTGLKFSSGYMKVNQIPNKNYEVLLSKMCVGKSYCTPLKNYQKDKFKLPIGFDSAYLYNEQQKPDIFRHQYVLFQNSQVLPCFIVHFQFDNQRVGSLKPPLCQLCQDTLAKFYCQVQQVNLCPECDEENHKTKLTAKHTRIDIGQKPKGFGHCISHPDIKLQLFCTVCNEPLCINCKINGNHMSGEFGTHPVVRIKQAYAQSTQRSKQMDPNIEKRKNQLAELLGNIDLKIKQINRNASFVQQELYQKLQNALKELQELTQKKMSYLIGDQLELKRQYDQIQWMESFLKYEQQVLAPSDFLSAWARHMKLRKQILNLANIPVITDVKPDIKVEGKLKVITENMLRNLNPNQNQKGVMDLLNQKSKRQSFESPVKKEKDDFLIGTTPFRRNIFNKHQLDKNSMLIKSAMTGKIKNVTPEYESPIKSQNNNLKLSHFNRQDSEK